jgi:hypothetical protein
VISLRKVFEKVLGRELKNKKEECAMSRRMNTAVHSKNSTIEKIPVWCNGDKCNAEYWSYNSDLDNYEVREEDLELIAETLRDENCLLGATNG